MANVTRDELIAITREEFGDDAHTDRICYAIANVDLATYRDDADADCDDETNANDATLVALALDYHFGIGWDLTD